LWTKDVNEAGGIELSDGTYTIALVEYDDQSSPEEAIKAIQRLVDQDKVDLLLPPWGTAMNLAIAPVFHQLGYPLLGVANLSDKSPDLAKQRPGYFSFLGTSSQYSEAIADLLGDFAAQGKIGKRVALPYVDAEFALDFVKPFRPALQAAGFEIVYDQGYPMEVSDMQSIVTEIMRLNPDAVIGITYPNDTMLYVPPMKVLGFDPPLLFLANGPNYYFFYGTYADDAEGVMGLGGIDVRNQQLVDFSKRFAAFNGTEADRWGGHVYYVVGQVIQQAFERVGKIDRKAIGDEILKGTFDYDHGPGEAHR
jgi:branched-chain amino acid transport system substrate-binding protein